MDSTIEQLWYGNIAPWENCGVGDEEIEHLVMQMGEYEETLRKDLAEQHKEMFVRYVRWSDQYACCISAKAFRDGFRLAAQLLLETMMGT